MTPVLASILLPAHVKEVETFLVRHIRTIYQAVLVRAVRNYRRAAAIATVFLVLCLSLGMRLGTEFLPKLEEGNMSIRAVMPPTITLEAGSIRWRGFATSFRAFRRSGPCFPSRTRR